MVDFYPRCNDHRMRTWNGSTLDYLYNHSVQSSLLGLLSNIRPHLGRCDLFDSIIANLSSDEWAISLNYDALLIAVFRNLILLAVRMELRAGMIVVVEISFSSDKYRLYLASLQFD